VLSRSLATTGTSLLLPRYAHSSALGDRDRQFQLYSKGVLASMAISIPIVVSLLAFGPGLLHLWLHTVPPKTYQVLVALNIATLLQLPGSASYLLLIGQGRSALVARIALPAGLVNLGCSIAATFWLGPVGPAIGSLPQVILVDLILMPVLCCRILEIPLARYVREAIAPLLLPLLTAGAVAALLIWLVGTTSAILAPVESVTVTLVAWAALLALLAKTDPAVLAAATEFVRRRRERKSHQDGPV
jgi:O-antigen/teichoic acid export membrane protein